MGNTITYETLYESMLQERLARPQNWKELCDVTYTDTRVISTSYDSDTGGFPTVSTVTRGTAFSFSDMVETAESLTISTGRDLPVFVDLADLAQSPWTKPMEIFKRIGQRLNEFIEVDFLDDHASWTNIGTSSIGGGGTTTTQITVSAANVDDIIRAIRTAVRAANGQNLMTEKGIGFAWSPANFEFLEAFAQANGFESADESLQNGLAAQVKYLGAFHYITNDNAANHMFAGVRQLHRIGILRGTYGKAHTIPFPAGSSNNNLSGTAFYSRIDDGTLAPTTYVPILFDINVA